MNAELKAKWVEALRSGKYQQGREQLNEADQLFCCLGVLCEIEGLDKFYENMDRVGYRFPTDEIDRALLPEKYRRTIGLDTLTQHESRDSLTGKVVGHFTQHEYCMYMNDTEKRTFAEIADVIEREF